jgi:serine/threonine protein kinase
MTGGNWREPPDPHGALPASVNENPAPGTLVAGKYRVESVIGVGGMGVVVAALHEQLGRRVAIKFIHAEAASNEAAVGRFLREARAAASLSNEHVTRVLDVGTLENGAPYIVMEYLAGVDVGEMLRRDGVLSVAQAVEVVVQACEALAEAHVRGIVHRDLKPANLFATKRSDGLPLIKVLDFGISKAAEIVPSAGDVSFTASGMIMGSPAYMSPEQVRSSKAVDARSDVWSLGVILYELLTGVSPFAGTTASETLAKIVADDPVPIRDLRPDLPAPLAATIAQCLARKIDVRVQSVADLAARLQPFVEGEAALAVKRILRVGGISDSGTRTIPPSLLPTTGAPGSETERPWLRSGAASAIPHRRRIWLGGTAVATLVGAVIVVVLMTRRGSAPPPPPVASALLAASPPARDGVPPTVTPSAIAEPSIAAPAITAPPDEETTAPSDASSSTKSPVGPARHVPVAAPAPPARSRAAHGGPVDCDPPFTLDSAGYRVPKPECL